MADDGLDGARAKLARSLPEVLNVAIEALLASRPADGRDLKALNADTRVAIANLQALFRLAAWLAAERQAEAERTEGLRALDAARDRVARLAETEDEG